MPLLTADIRTILQNGGVISFPSTVTGGTGLVNTGIVDQVVDNNYSKVNLTADVVANTITLTRVSNDSTTNNGVNIFTVDVMATVGAINPPGYIYTGDFSGCVFYLYKTGPNQVTGVHAYSGSQPVTTRVGVFRKKVVNQVVREFGPTDYFTRNPAMMICRYPTRGEMDLSTGERSLAFLSCVDTTTATTFLFTVANSPGGARVVRMLSAYHVKF
ncbi:MAG: hypothetical protein J0H91_14605 [Rhodospirillales bacterium]|nr:hypothetical protein [Rhodospirillales bacterium]